MWVWEGVPCQVTGHCPFRTTALSIHTRNTANNPSSAISSQRSTHTYSKNTLHTNPETSKCWKCSQPENIEMPEAEGAVEFANRRPTTKQKLAAKTGLLLARQEPATQTEVHAQQSAHAGSCAGWCVYHNAKGGPGVLLIIDIIIRYEGNGGSMAISLTCPHDTKGHGKPARTRHTSTGQLRSWHIGINTASSARPKAPCTPDVLHCALIASIQADTASKNENTCVHRSRHRHCRRALYSGPCSMKNVS